MNCRQIGSTSYQTSRLALGCVTFGREIDEQASGAIMDYAVQNGISLFDTAEVYGGGASETILGHWMKDRGARASVVVQTKTLAHRPEDVLRGVDSSLERLQTGKIDLYLLHRLSPDTPLNETLDALGIAMRQGKIGAIGSSNCTAAQLKDAIDISRRYGLPRFEVQQPIYNLAAREIEEEFLPFCVTENIGTIAYSPLGAGFLTGKYLDSIPAGSRFDVVAGHQNVYFSQRNFEIVRELSQLSARTGVPMVRLAMSWALRNPALTAVLVGARTRAHLDNALESLHSELRPEWLDEMDRFSRPSMTPLP